MTRARMIVTLLIAALLAACAHHEPPAPPVRPVQLFEARNAAGLASAVFAGEDRVRSALDGREGVWVAGVNSPATLGSSAATPNSGIWRGTAMKSPGLISPTVTQRR